MELFRSFGVLARAFALLLSMAAFGTASPALADEVAAPGCVASVPADLTLEPGTEAAFEWRCDGEIPDLGPGRIAVMLGTAQSGQAYLQSRYGYFDGLTLAVMEDDQILATARHDPDEILANYADVSFSVPIHSLMSEIDPTAGDNANYIVVFEGTEFPAIISSAKLVDIPVNERSDTISKAVLIALMIGCLFLPALVDLAFFRVLKAKFLIWHAGLGVAMAWHLSASGLMGIFYPISVTEMNNHAIASFGMITVCGIFFATMFIEKDKQPPKLRFALQWSTIVVIVITALRMARIDVFEPYSATVYFAMFIPVLCLMFAFVTVAAVNGSRAVWFQIAAWTPFFALGALRLGTMLGTDSTYIEGAWVFRIGAITEVTVTTMGIVDRLIAIRRERDAAKTNAETLTRLSERDALTGLFNRRAIEDRFTDLRSEGFDTFALIDLDRFKNVNDDFGHQVGDRALIACANAIRGPKNAGVARDAIALRLGGEEFFVLLRGEHTLERAEALRQAIPLRIANEVEGLNRPVTASMGVIELPNGCDELMSFEDLYARADQLLYEAKAAGRNRMCYERLKLFHEAPPARPLGEAAA